MSVFILKVNFYHDHTKIIICNQNEEYLLTYINEDRISTTFRLTTLLMSGCSLELKHRMEYALNMLLQRCNWKPFRVDPMGLLSTVRSTEKPAAGHRACWRRWTGEVRRQTLSGLLDCWTQAGVRCTVDFGQSKGGAECRFPEVPVAKRFIGQFCRTMHWLLSSLRGEHFQPEDLELWIYFLKGREKGGYSLAV